jgi:hypothetical protein
VEKSDIELNEFKNYFFEKSKREKTMNKLEKQTNKNPLAFKGFLSANSERLLYVN